MDNNEQRYYDPKTLNRVFAVTSVIFLASLVAMFYYDYDREWREHQATFRKIDIGSARERLERDQKRLEQAQEYQQLTEALSTARAEQSRTSVTVEQERAELARLTKQRDSVREEMNFEIAEHAAAKYKFEQARAKGAPGAAKLEKALLKREQAAAEKKLSVEQLESQMGERRAAIEQDTATVVALERQLAQLTSRSDLLIRKLATLDPARLSALDKVGDKVRDLPGMDMFNPRYNVRDHQLIIDGITEDMVFTRVPRVDRCKACHMGIADQRFADEDNPHRAHPNLDLFLAQSSAHPMKEFGCTSCHSGRGRGTSFTTAVHTPDSAEEREEWEKEHDWERLHHWEAPMHPARYTQAGCYKCHTDNPELEGADKLNLGLAIVRKAGCNGCHLIDRFNGEPKAGPGLRRLKSKLTPDWAFKWIKGPKEFRAHTWMPAFFKQSNNSDIAPRTDVELKAMVHYLFAESEDRAGQAEGKRTAAGNAENGKRLTKARGCQACHMLADDPYDATLSVDAMRRQQGPKLVGMASKTTAAWLYGWLKDPATHSPDTRMPNLRLSDEDARDITAYLMAVEGDGTLTEAVPATDERMLDEVTLELMAKNMSQVAAKAKVHGMAVEEKLAYTGKQMTRHYGCFGCHDIPGFEDEQPIGTDLSEEGSKPIAQLDFGLRHDLEHVNYAWFEEKLKDPRSFDHGLVKKPGERLLMPHFGFDEHEREAVVTCLLAFAKPDSELKKALPRTPRNMFIEEGEKLITQLNCRGCHVIDGAGGAIEPSLVKWVAEHPPGQEPAAEKDPEEEEEDDGWGDEEDEAIDPEILARAYMPPDLTGEGAKVQPEWLFSFLGDPASVRPWFEARMPTYSLTGAERNTILRYFSYLDSQKFPFEKPVTVDTNSVEFKAAEKMFSPAVMNCKSCHVVAGKTPEGKTAAEWAPDLGMARDRLKADWTLKWLLDPQALIPGTKMPQYWPEDGPSPLPDLGADTLRQCRAVRDYLFTLEEE
ncbi:MAG: c-type cytochrome [Kiritimatiellia bacterium]|nr:c-type cytochrome [Kiritimatiellia bacterium]